MPHPTLAELVRSVIEAGREWDLDISDRDGTLWLEDTPQSPMEWWRSLVSTHLAEAVHRLDGLDGPGLLHIDDYGITASLSPGRPSASP